MSRRSGLSQGLWLSMWVLWIALAGQQVVDVARFDAPWPVWLLRVVPLLLFMPSVLRGSLRAVIWLCFVLLFYFISAVELLFAQPDDVIAVVGVSAVVGVFITAAFYIRTRGRELNAAQAEVIATASSSTGAN